MTRHNIAGAGHHPPEQESRLGDGVFRDIFQHSPDPAWILDQDNRFIECNQAAIDLLGYPDRSAVLNTHPRDHSPAYQPDGEASASKAEQMLGLARQNGVHRFEWLHQRANGSTFMAEVTLSAFVIAGQQMLHAHWRDISHAHASAERLRTNRLLFDDLFQLTPVAAAISSVASGKYLVVNDAYSTTFGWATHELRGRTSADIALWPDRQVRTAWIETMRQHGIVHDYPVRLAKRDGQLLDISLFSSLVEFGGEECVLTVLHDVTQRLQDEANQLRLQQQLEQQVAQRTEELLKAKVEAEAANRAKSAFLSNMSHEMRTPLHQMSGLTQLIRREPLSEKQNDLVAKLETVGHRLFSIIDTILKLTELETRQFIIEERPLDIARLLGDIVTALGTKAAGLGLTLGCAIEPLPTRVLGDSAHLTTALLNYANNALRFTTSGQVTLRCRCLETLPEHLLLRFEVEDSGGGITPETLPRLFNIFEQADNSETRSHGGTGIGLIMTKKLAQLMGGDAGCDSTPGVGSTFWFTVRLRKA